MKKEIKAIWHRPGLWVFFLCGLGLLVGSSARAAEAQDLRLRGRLQARWQLQEGAQDDLQHQFVLRRARIDGRWDAQDWLRVVLELEAGEGLVDDAAGPVVKDAYGRLKFDRALVVHVGHFKKPFSRLKMTSAWDLLIPIRGALNGLAIADTRHGGFGGRDLGLMVSGRFQWQGRLRYYLGAFSGTDIATGQKENRKDYVARLQWRPFKGLEFSVNAAHKLFEQAGLDRTANLFGADLLWRFFDFHLQIEGAYGDNVEARAGHKLLGGHAIVAYRIGLSADWSLRPALMAEYLDPDSEVQWGKLLRFGGALNFDYRESLRVVLFAELATDRGRYESTLEDDHWVEGDDRFFVQLNLML